MFFRILATFLALSTMTPTSSAQTSIVSKEGLLQAAYLATNPAHAVKDPATGEARGVAVDLARELGRSVGAAVTLMALQNPQRVIDAVRNGEADIGFVAYNPERAGPVEFSKPYLLVRQTFLVRADSQLRSVADVDRAAVKLGATRNDSIALYLRRTLKQAQLLEQDDSSRDTVLRMLRERTLDVFGANRQRLTDMLQGATDLRLLPDDLYGVEQTIIVPSGRRDALDRVNRFIDDVRTSGFLQKSIEQSGVVGIAIAGAR
jgi:polar amino acid transport system substrate-binding protein